MSILLVLIPVTLLFVLAGGVAFFWAVNHDQFDDLETPSLTPLLDNPPDEEGAETRRLSTGGAPAPPAGQGSA